MNLYYFQDPHGNFGDDLNPWLWRQLSPTLLDEDDGALFVGIGTLLNHRLPAAPVKHVFGSGFGYGERPRIDSRWVFHAVRGYETARLLGVPRQKVITDAAVLVRAVSRPRAEVADSRIGFMPHCQSSQYFDWSTLCDELGFRYICAQWPVEQVLFEMSRCETMICEAMHGAIVADALRIPWIPVSCYDYISSFKWRDWLSTLELPYVPQSITSLYDVDRSAKASVRVKNAVKRQLTRAGFGSRHWTAPPPGRTGRSERDRALTQLDAASRSRAYLSSDSLIEAHTERYQELLLGLTQDRARRPEKIEEVSGRMLLPTEPGAEDAA